MIPPHVAAFLAQIEPHQVGLLALAIAGLLLITLPVDWIKRR